MGLDSDAYLRFRNLSGMFYRQLPFHLGRTEIKQG